ncbi:prolipoprotein diacylglyceryl transferase [Candidatus Woesearchaeota archaeon]|nr:prolipoprotein diacylglyceryl transferase [Candidatus Woesearchaeota archaeon]
MFYHNINPVLFKIGIFEIRYYGLIFILGFLIGYLFLVYLAKERKLNLTKDDISDLLLYLLIGIIAGARLFYILFYNLGFYLENPLEMFALWHGGLSFHGGLAGAVIAILLFCKKKKVSFYEIIDIVVIPVALGLAFGRIGNFLNGELYGRITNLPWAVKFKGAEGFRHPSQLYESLKNLVIFSVLWFIRNKKLPNGFLFWSFVTLYSVLRFFVEFVREPDPQLGFIIFSMTMGQILSIITCSIGIYFLFRLKYESKNNH